ncbi:NRDE family protein [Acinetobacter populi]|uniref:Serine/threonine protein phosphatase n=1 Tax=Acinetobacter populi TaxID=1582270 RepID=A0A1Z9Z2E2_9GAMM|nr:NRDE family protein [Acinetobacter populi]OUY08592.1 serine/threonine protein phosphatase [Acinetobacter populi]
MCILALAWQVLEDIPLFLISNRDEFYHRAAQPLAHWPHSPIFAGQDLQQGGTWQGIAEQGRWAIVTNFREGGQTTQYPTSRGDLVKDFLCSDLPPIRFAKQLESRQQDYAGFNLIVGDRQQAVYMSNRGEAPQILPKGVYVLSNGLMSEHWQKTAHLRKRFTQELLPLMQLPQVTLAEQLDTAWDILQDQRKVTVSLLPHTGIGEEMELLLSSTFIQSEVYGTRCSNVLSIKDEQINWWEKTQQGQHAGEIRQIHIK